MFCQVGLNKSPFSISLYVLLSESGQNTFQHPLVYFDKWFRLTTFQHPQYVLLSGSNQKPFKYLLVYFANWVRLKTFHTCSYVLLSESGQKPFQHLLVYFANWNLFSTSSYIATRNYCVCVSTLDGRVVRWLLTRKVGLACRVQITAEVIAFPFRQIPLKRYECMSPPRYWLIAALFRLYNLECQLVQQKKNY